MAKEVIADFIDKRTNDRIGLVVFAAESITQCPLTLDYTILKDLVERVKFGMLEDGTEEIRLTRQGLLRVDSLLPEFYAERYRGARYT